MVRARAFYRGNLNVRWFYYRVNGRANGPVVFGFGLVTIDISMILLVLKNKESERDDRREDGP